MPENSLSTKDKIVVIAQPILFIVSLKWGAAWPSWKLAWCHAPHTNCLVLQQPIRVEEICFVAPSCKRNFQGNGA